jgi:hypothetical protein
MNHKRGRKLEKNIMQKRILNVLIACEESQAECEAFRELGHRAFSCDIQKCKQKGHPEWHIHGDVSPYLDGVTKFSTQDGKTHKLKQWDLIIAHPPCTYLCKLSSCQLYKPITGWAWINGVYVECNEERYHKMIAGREFFLKCLSAKAPYLAVENPIPMRAANLPRPDAYACPSWFGVKYTKKTCYWLRNLPPLMAGVVYPDAKCFVQCSRGKYRSRTFPALAKAIAKQWSEYILDDIDKSKENRLI